MSTYSTNLALELIGTGEQAGVWGNTTNTNLGTLIEQAISGYVTQAVATGTDTTITIPNGATGVARNMYIELTGTGGTNTNLIVPANKKLYFIFNNSTGAVTVKVSGQTGVSVPTGKKMVLVSNGTDIVNGLNYIADFGSNSATITQLTATSATITNLTLTSLVISNLSIASANITTLTATNETISGNLTLSGGTANGVLYLNGSKVATSGSALVFNGSDLTIGGTATNGKLNLLQSLSGASNAAGIWLSDNATTSMYLNNTSSGVSSVWTSGSLAFGVGNGTFAEAMRLTSTGLGIGTASPTRKLQVATSAGQWGVENYSTGTKAVSVNSANNAVAPFGIQASAIDFLTGGSGSATMVLDASGNLGIGTASPAQKLHISAASATSAVRLTRTGTFPGDFTLQSGGYSTPSFLIYDNTAAAERLLIDGSGNLGIGTASPSDILTLAGGASGSYGLTINNAKVGGGTKAIFQYDATNAIALVGGNTTNGLAFQTLTAGNLTTKAVIDASGNLGIGTTTMKNTVLTGGGTGITIGAAAAPNLAIWDTTDAGYVTYLGQINENAYLGNAANGFMSFGTNNTERMRLTAAGDLGIGTASPGQKLEVAGNQRFTGSQVGTKIENRQTAVSVTGATTILDDAGSLGRLVVVNGESGSNRFCDLVLCSTGVSPTVVSSFTALGSPAARTYTRSGSALQLAMASGTYVVFALALGY